MDKLTKEDLDYIFVDLIDKGFVILASVNQVNQFTLGKKYGNIDISAMVNNDRVFRSALSLFKKTYGFKYSDVREVLLFALPYIEEKYNKKITISSDEMKDNNSKFYNNIEEFDKHYCSFFRKNTLLLEIKITLR